MTRVTIINTFQPDMRTVSKNVTLDNIPDGCKVYYLIFGSTDIDKSIVKDLESLGTEYGTNLYVGFLSMVDPRYENMAAYFDLKFLPAIVITAESLFATIEKHSESAFVRLDNHILLKDVESVKSLIRLLYNLFITNA